MSEAANPSRERILARIGKALRQKTVLPEGKGEPIFAPVGNLLRRFEQKCTANITECVVTNGSAETEIKLRAILAEIPVGEVFSEDAPLLRQMLEGASREVKWSSTGPPSESCQVTITQVHALIASTGSLLVSSSCGGRGASVVAPVHIVVAHESQLIADVDAALELVGRMKLAMSASFIGVITGCSRTGDIEKLLVIGAHGPKRLVVIVER